MQFNLFISKVFVKRLMVTMLGPASTKSLRYLQDVISFHPFQITLKLYRSGQWHTNTKNQWRIKFSDRAKLRRILWRKWSFHGLLLLHGSPAFSRHPSLVYSSLTCLIFVLPLVCSLCKAHNIAELRCCRKYQKKFYFQHYLVYVENNHQRATTETTE